MVKIGTLASQSETRRRRDGRCGERGRHQHGLCPGREPAYLGVGYIIVRNSPRSTFRVAWWLGLMVPLLIYFLGPQLQTMLPAGLDRSSLGGMSTAVWKFIVRPIAVGGMFVGACYTLFACGPASPSA